MVFFFVFECCGLVKEKQQFCIVVVIVFVWYFNGFIYSDY